MSNQPTTASTTQITVSVPQFLADSVQSPTHYVALKRVMLEIFNSHITSDAYKSSPSEDMSTIVFESLSDLVDNLFLLKSQ